MSTYNKSSTITRSERPEKRHHVVVVVLGDLGRSPRMQYHTLSLLKAGHIVSFVGYEGTELIPDLCRNDENADPKVNHFLRRLNVIRFSLPAPAFLRKFALPIYFVWRVLSLCFYLIYILFVSIPSEQRQKTQVRHQEPTINSENYHRQKVDCVLVQNPPAMPLIFIAYVYCRIIKARLIIDWHNLGFSMLSNSRISSVAKLYEQVMAPLADGHLCVTAAMMRYLEQEFKILNRDERIRVLHDCPPDMFRPLAAEEQHHFLSKMHNKLCGNCPKRWHQNLSVPRQTLFTEQITKDELQSGESSLEYIYQPRVGRPALVTSSTSWTADEDFGQLLDALLILDKTIREEENITSSLLNVLVVVTGKGPQKEYYEERMSKLKMDNVAIQTVWLEPVDYPRLLACADVGVSLHTSTSGLDLPMKVLDLFGCQVPVLARDFDCLDELVQNDRNGKTFQSSSELASHLFNLLRPLATSKSQNTPTEGISTSEGMAPHSYGELAKYSDALKGRKRWDDNWTQHALPLIIG